MNYEIFIKSMGVHGLKVFRRVNENIRYRVKNWKLTADRL